MGCRADQGSSAGGQLVGPTSVIVHNDPQRCMDIGCVLASRHERTLRGDNLRLSRKDAPWVRFGWPWRY